MNSSVALTIALFDTIGNLSSPNKIIETGKARKTVLRQRCLYVAHETISLQMEMVRGAVRQKCSVSSAPSFIGHIRL